MSDIINIITHPGYLVNKENYNQKVYYEQLEKAKLNIFLHPQIGELEKKFYTRKYYNLFIENVKNVKSSDVALEEFDKNNDFISFHYPAKHLRNYLFRLITRNRKRKKIKSKKYSKRIHNIIHNKKEEIIKLMLKMDKTIFNNNCCTKNHLEFRKQLENDFPKKPYTEDGQWNMHLNGTILNSFNIIIKKLKEDCFVEEDQIFLFGEHYNQCVKNTADVMDKLKLKYTIIPELTSYNSTCEISGKDIKEENKHFIII